MYKLLLVLFLPVALADRIKVKANTTQINKYRQDFLKQMLAGIPLSLPKFVLQNNNNVDDDDSVILYYLYNRQNPRDSISINDDLSPINLRWPVKILVHGWTEHYYVEWCKNMTAAYLKRGNYNIIVLDWSSKGDADYISASFAVPAVARKVGDFIVERLNKERKVALERLHLISHSLGCHVAGIVGQRVFELTQSKVGRITALDPAAPYFDFFTLSDKDRLSADDADFVDIVHTDGGWLGFRNSVGSADFYPNGGKAYQPGCSLLRADVKYEDLFCSHARSHRYFRLSILSRQMTAVPCENWDKFNKGDCNDNTEVPFGENAPHNLTGNYFLRTTEDILS